MLKPLLHLMFFLSGIATVLIGQVLPILSRSFGLNDLYAGFFFPAQFSGSIIGTLVSGRFAQRNDHKNAVVTGGFCFCLGILLLTIESYAACLSGFFILGLGVGLTLPSINMVVVELNPERSGPALSFLNFFWGLGAIVCKPFVDAFSSETNFVGTALFLTVAIAVTTILLIFTAVQSRSHSPMETADSNSTPIWRHPVAWAIAAFNLVHVGFESGMGGWLTTYAGRLPGEMPAGWLSPTLFYFLLFVIGRGAAPILFRFLDDNKMLFLGLFIVAAGMVLALSADSVALLGTGAALAGFGTSWLFPTNISRFSKTFGPEATRRATPLFVAGTIGAALSTWLVGFVSDAAGGLWFGMLVLGVFSAVLIVIQTLLVLRTGAHDGMKI
ncbi:MAG: MFS transporter [Acidobacteriota bacterium]|nr:MAG: MFS transporter [Acidobacteriota bacterium]